MIKREILTSRKVFDTTTNPTHHHETLRHITIVSCHANTPLSQSQRAFFDLHVKLVYPKISDTDSQSDLAKFKKEKNVKRNVIVMLLL